MTCSPVLLEASQHSSWVTRVMHGNSGSGSTPEPYPAQRGVRGSVGPVVPREGRPVSAPVVSREQLMVEVGGLPGVRLATAPHPRGAAPQRKSLHRVRPYTSMFAATTTAVPPGDEYSARELEMARVVNKAREAPKEFAREMEKSFVFCEGMTAVGVKRKIKELRVIMGGCEKELAELKGNHDEEIGKIRGERAEEVAAVGKKSQRRKSQPDLEAINAEYEVKIEEVETRQNMEKTLLENALATATGDLTHYTDSLVPVQNAVDYFTSTPKAGLLRYSRGLSLVARHPQYPSTKRKNSKKTLRQKNPLQHRPEYGLTLGDTSAVLGDLNSATNTAVNEFFNVVCYKSGSRESIMSPKSGVLGVGWVAHCAVLLAEGFLESRHVRVRRHLSLQDVRHQAGFSRDPKVYPAELLGGVDVIKPTEHPLKASDSGVADIVVSEGGAADAIFASFNRERPVADPYILTQRRGGKVMISARVSADRILHIFHKKTSPIGYTWAGPIHISKPKTMLFPPAPFPQTTREHLHLEGLISSPLASPLPPSSTHAFTISLPSRRRSVVLSQPPDVSKPLHLISEDSDEVVYSRKIRLGRGRAVSLLVDSACVTYWMVED